MKSFAPLLLIALFTPLFNGCYSPTLPLPPPVRTELEVFPPDADGWVRVQGGPGVADPGEQIVIINQNTQYGWIVPVTDEGFSVDVVAEIGDILIFSRKIGDEIGQSIPITVPAE